MKLWIRNLLLALFAVSTVISLVSCGSTKVISPSSLPGYTVICSQSADSEQKAAVDAMKHNLDSLLGSEIPLHDDGESPVALEILVGETNRPESETFMNSLRYRDHGFAVVGDKIVIGGHTQETLGLAMEAFYETLTKISNGEKVKLTEGEYVTRETYAFEDTSVCGLSSKNLSVVYADHKGKEFAFCLAEALSSRCGYAIKAISQQESASVSGNLILLGVSGQRGLTAPKPSGPAATYVESASDAVLLAGGEFGFEHLCYTLLAEVLSGTGDSVPLPSLSDKANSLLRTVSYNVLVSQRSEQRIKALIDSIRQMKPDTVGLQEANAAWMKDFASYLPEYASVGVGRDGPNSEGTFILYRKDKFTLLDSGTRWLSDTPKYISKFRDSKYLRTYTYAVLKRNSDGAVFVHVNTHLDLYESVQTKQTGVLLKELKQFKDYPIVITGDFNCTSESDSYKLIAKTGYSDSASAAQISKKSSTFRSAGNVIDFCFVTPTLLQTLHYRVFNGKVNGIYPSDHNAVYIDFILK